MTMLLFALYSVIILITILLIFHYKRDRNFKNQKYLSNNTKILITGGSLGIGRELIHLLITLFNCQIINLDMRESEFESLKSEYSDKIINIPCNISKIKNIIEFLKGKGVNPDEIDIIINNAGVANNLRLEELSEIQMISTMEVNLISPMKIIKNQNLNWVIKRYILLLYAQSCHMLFLLIVVIIYHLNGDYMALLKVLEMNIYIMRIIYLQLFAHLQLILECFLIFFCV